MLIKNFLRKILMLRYKFGYNKIHYIGKNVNLPINMIISWGQNIDIQHNTSIGGGSILYATNEKISIGHHVVIGRNVRIVTGNHERRLGMFCRDITEPLKNHNIGLD